MKHDQRPTFWELFFAFLTRVWDDDDRWIFFVVAALILVAIFS